MGCKLSQDWGAMHNPDQKTFSCWLGVTKTPESSEPAKNHCLTPQKWSQGWGCAAQCHTLGCPVHGQQLGFADPSSSGYSTVLCPTKAWEWAKLRELGILGSGCVGDNVWPSAS